MLLAFQSSGCSSVFHHHHRQEHFSVATLHIREISSIASRLSFVNYYYLFFRCFTGHITTRPEMSQNWHFFSVSHWVRALFLYFSLRKISRTLLHFTICEPKLLLLLKRERWKKHSSGWRNFVRITNSLHIKCAILRSFIPSQKHTHTHTQQTCLIKCRASVCACTTIECTKLAFISFWMSERHAQRFACS